MKKKLLQKLKEKTGASIVFALLVFLICTLVGSTMLSAASATSGTLTNTWDYDKDVYLLKSGVDLITDGFQSQFIANSLEADEKGNLLVPQSSKLDTLYIPLCATVYNTEQSCSESFTMTLNTTADVINATVTMDTDYSVTIQLTKEGTNRSVEVYLRSSCATGNTIKEKGASVSWGSPVVNVK